MQEKSESQGQRLQLLQVYIWTLNTEPRRLERPKSEPEISNKEPRRLKRPKST